MRDESNKDRALLDAQVLEQLPEPLRSQANRVLRALEMVQAGEMEMAQELLREIPRSSPYADWRLLVRGLVAWYGSDHREALQSWSRLDQGRRPARIAAVLMQVSEVAGNCQPTGSNSNSAADRADPPGDSAGEAASSTRPVPDNQTVFLAPASPDMTALVRQIRDQRPALRIAREIASVRHRDPETKLSASQISLLTELRTKYVRHDPQLVRKISEACVDLAFNQPEPELFRLLTSRLPGPPHDPVWSLTTSQYLDRFEGAESVQSRHLKNYLNDDLPKNERIPVDLRSALASLLHQADGTDLLRQTGAIWVNESQTLSQARQAFERSVKAWPRNRAAWEGLVSCVEKVPDQGTYESLKKAEQAAIDVKAASMRERWITALPEDVPPKLWLIDHYLQTDRPALARKLIDGLERTPLENPRMKLLPWKVRLFEAFALSKKKREISSAKAALADSEQVWPA